MKKEEEEKEEGRRKKERRGAQATSWVIGNKFPTATKQPTTDWAN